MTILLYVFVGWLAVVAVLTAALLLAAFFADTVHRDTILHGDNPRVER